MDAEGVQEHDIIARRPRDGQFDITQRLRGREPVLEGPLPRKQAALRAAALAALHSSDAWIEEAPGELRLL